MDTSLQIMEYFFAGFMTVMVGGLLVMILLLFGWIIKDSIEADWKNFVMNALWIIVAILVCTLVGYAMKENVVPSIMR